MSDILSVTYSYSIPVTQSDATPDPNGPFAGFIVQAAGLVKYTNPQGKTDIIQANAGVIYPIQTQRIWSTGTTAGSASGLIASLGP